MPKAIKAYVRYVDAINRAVGRSVMWLVLVMMCVLLYAVIARAVFGVSYIWIVETSQMLLAAYYILGGAWAMQDDTHVRMDLLYGRLSPVRRAQVDAFTILFVIFYLVVMLRGGWSSTEYAIVYQQKNYSAWSPVLWPVKVVMTFGIFLILLQAISCLIRDIAAATGRPFK